MQYEKLLEKAYSELPEKKESEERFEIPRAQVRTVGNRTIIENFTQIAAALRRDPQHISKYLLRGLATTGNIESARLLLIGKISPERINIKIESYATEFVICTECKKPDTELKKKDRFTFVHCLACGASHSVRSKI